VLVTLIGKNKVNKLILPKNIVGNYWLSDKDSGKYMINIEAIDGNWQITSNDNVKVIAGTWKQTGDYEIKATKPNEEIIEKVTLKENSMHHICIGKANDVFILYCSPVYENNFIHLDIKGSKEVLIGKSPECDLSYKINLVDKIHASIYFANGSWNVKNLDKRFGTFVNNEPIISKQIDNGDVIYVMGLRIIMMGNSLFVNNPFDRLHYANHAFTLIENEENFLDLTPESDIDLENEDEEDYFSRAPRLTNQVEHVQVKVDGPPQKQNAEQMPLIIMMLPMLAMGTMSMFMLFTSISGLISGTAAVGQVLPQMIMGIGMLFGMLMMPIFNRSYQNKKKRRYEAKRQQKYSEYIESKSDLIDEIMETQRSILITNYLSAEDCQRLVLSKDRRLWERKIEEHDFLTIKTGNGDIPIEATVQYPESDFVMDEDNLMDLVKEFGNKSKILRKVPITLSLAEKHICALMAHKNKAPLEDYVKSLIMQLITFHSPEDLKLVFLINDNKEKQWDYVKKLPHTWSDAKDFRFFADSYHDMQEISMYLGETLQNRLPKEDSKREMDYKSFAPYYLIITDDYKKVENLKIMSEVLQSKNNLGFSVLFISSNFMKLPNECKTFIKLEDEIGVIFESEGFSKNQKHFVADVNKDICFEKTTNTVANIPIKYSNGNFSLPQQYTFMEMYDAGRIEQLNSLDRWRSNDSTLSLQAPLGVDTSGMAVMFDIHEKMHGPHGLIAGTTGSGKSEFIVTYILSLAVNYHPDDVTFVLIDYKGGGLAGAFKKGNTKLPHLVGTITNIDTVELNRSLTSIQSELRRRQNIFNVAREKTDEGAIDIYKYQKLYHEGVIDEPVSHLFIICDEFAELKTQQPEFMEELIRVARIGRSLGIHLILATQKPAGVVNDQIRSNSKFGICLKVQDKSDSNDIIGRSDAAFLKEAGRFYLQARK